MRIGRISLRWGDERESSDSWRLDKDARGFKEDALFKFPDLLKSASDTRSILDNINFASDIREKSRFARFSYFITMSWVSLVAGVTLLEGFGYHFKLESSDYIAFATTTTLNIIGHSYLVGRHLFGGNQKAPAGDLKQAAPIIAASIPSIPAIPDAPAPRP